MKFIEEPTAGEGYDFDDDAKEFRVLVTGDRDWDDSQVLGSFGWIYFDLRSMQKDLALQKVSMAIAHGGCRGADTYADEAARKLGIPVTVFPYIKELGRAGGPVRNRKMLKEFKPNLVLAFHDNLADSKGTKDMVIQALKAGVQVVRVNTKGQTFKITGVEP